MANAAILRRPIKVPTPACANCFPLNPPDKLTAHALPHPTMNTGDATQDVREYRASPELRRIAWYCAIGFVGIAPLFVWNGVFREAPRPAGELTLWSICLTAAYPALFAFFWFVVLRWKLRVDQDGVSRRRLFRWEFWPWSAFESGRIQKRGDTFYDPTRPWWRRRLGVFCLGNNDFQDLIDRVNSRHQLPPPGQSGS